MIDWAHPDLVELHGLIKQADAMLGGGCKLVEVQVNGVRIAGKPFGDDADCVLSGDSVVAMCGWNELMDKEPRKKK